METKSMRQKFEAVKLIKSLLPFLWEKQGNVRTLFLLTICLVFVSIGLNLSIPIMLKMIVSRLSLTDRNMSYQLCLLLFASGAIWTLSQVIQQARVIIMVHPLERCIRLFCSKLFDHLHCLPMHFHLNKKIGAITNALERAQNGFPSVFWGLFLIIVPTILELFMSAAILCYFYGLIYGIIILLILIIFVIFTSYAISWTSDIQKICNTQHNETNAHIVDSLLNFASVKYFNNKDYENEKCADHLKLREKLVIKFVSSLEFVRIGQHLIIGMGIILLTYTAGKQALSNIYDVSDFILINGYILQLAVPLSQMGFVARDVRKGLNEIQGVMALYQTKINESKFLEKTKHIGRLEDICFENVSFGYDGSRVILKNINFYIRTGQSIGIVGETGSGKSTISNLLFNFYDTESGKIRINGINIKEIKYESICNLFGIVAQDTTLFNTTIYENILFGRPNAEKKDVERAIRLACLDSFLENLPDHYNTMVGERGLKLSGGEKQRIAIARVFLKSPSLYIFDEATSSLDLATEKKIMANITSITKKATSITIAHRLSAVMNADEILVLKNGIVEERGNHDSLLGQRGIYFNLWKFQNRQAPHTAPVLI